jgi:hypothetical protein
MASSSLEPARDRLLQLLEQHEATRGLYVRSHGKQLILGRLERFGPDQEPEEDDRVRLTQMTNSVFGLSVKHHAGRWERTPFSGTPEQLVETMLATMQHLLADWP